MQTPDWQSQLDLAKDHANFGRNTSFLDLCERLANQHINDAVVLHRIAGLLQSYGFSSPAKTCLLQALTLSPSHRSLLMSLANTEFSLGKVQACEAIYRDLNKYFPSDLEVLRQQIFLSEYLFGKTNAELLAIAKQWGDCAIEAAGGPHPRPAFRETKGVPKQVLRIGYVSGDFCQHTVGLLLKEVLANHDTAQFEVYTYSAGTVTDWVTDVIRSQSRFYDVSALTDLEMVNLIRSHGIDVLIDLSGHTAGSRLAAFAYRPALVQLSWLGYYATTGLDCIDAVLLDQWHVSSSSPYQFIESIEQLPLGRWCFYPAFPAPAPAPPPALENGFVTFASFNNTLKYNPAVYRLWSAILLAIPHSRLILKWRTFNDPEFTAAVLKQFTQTGIDPSRIELRGPSFHLQMLEEYRDIDIALDPFPFSGGATSCEALYMGVPVITWPQERVVSRQTYAFLSSIQHPELAVHSEAAYLEKAIALAADTKALCQYRETLRSEMIGSPLMQAKEFTKSLELTIVNLYKRIHSQ
jgi:predicted O-linked N-acetylglucosamine transferase (SPINDLY family)